MSKMIWSIETTSVETGSYKATVTHGVIRCEYISDMKNAEPKPFGTESMNKQAKDVARAGWRFWADEPEWHQPRLISFSNVGTGIWEIVIQDAYLD